MVRRRSRSGGGRSGTKFYKVLNLHGSPLRLPPFSKHSGHLPACAMRPTPDNHDQPPTLRSSFEAGCIASQGCAHGRGCSMSGIRKLAVVPMRSTTMSSVPQIPLPLLSRTLPSI
jgi:hypothetical protein